MCYHGYQEHSASAVVGSIPAFLDNTTANTCDATAASTVTEELRDLLVNNGL